MCPILFLRFLKEARGELFAKSSPRIRILLACLFDRNCASDGHTNHGVVTAYYSILYIVTCYHRSKILSIIAGSKYTWGAEHNFKDSAFLAVGNRTSLAGLLFIIPWLTAYCRLPVKIPRSTDNVLRLYRASTFELINLCNPTVLRAVSLYAPNAGLMCELILFL